MVAAIQSMLKSVRGGFGGPGWCGGVKELIAFLVVVHMADAFTWFDPKDMKFGHMIAGK